MNKDNCKVTIVQYFDDKYDYYRFKYDDKELLLSGTGTGAVRKDVLFADTSAATPIIQRYDAQLKCEILSINTISVGKPLKYNANVAKKDVLQYHAAQLLCDLKLADFTDRLSAPADKGEAEKIISHIIGKNIILPDVLTVESVLFQILNEIGERCTENVFEVAINAGILKSIEKEYFWFGEPIGLLQLIGLYEETTYPDSPLYNDELCGICFNLLNVVTDNKRCSVRLVEEDKKFFDLLTNTYERRIVYPYYEDTGVCVRKETFFDKDGKEMIGFYVPGASLNHTYINEYTTTDNINYVFSTLFDRHIRKWGRAIPVLYNDITGKTEHLHNRMNVRMYSILMTKNNFVYYIADDSIFSYNINSGEKKVVFKEKNGCMIQEVPTISDDGRYLLFFYGTVVQHLPNRACVLDTLTGECRIILDTPWVDEHLNGHVNPFVGHFIINPKFPNLINFLHGGGANVEDRMWLTDTNTGDIWEAYKQIMTEDGTFLEALTHWVWSSDGKRLCFVRIRRDTDPSVGKGGICYLDMEKNDGILHEMVTEREAIHATPDCNDRLFVYDTYNDEPEKYIYSSDVSLYNTENGEERLLHRIFINKAHPGHPHPIFSSDGKNVLFAFSPDNSGRTCVCIEKVDY